ncbi:BNR repeat-containing protein [Neolewinella antarctica]|uniref:Neuraminidase n=1 Tax=Neolewinella antarctica TaxID=442734 RepID=A0ABX0XGX9_9BACT|nr:BNR repeat-containing protein [Neolewinella antarctica]NJC28400.1 hypothetical protein [Neolewinella antarctica]
MTVTSHQKQQAMIGIFTPDPNLPTVMSITHRPAIHLLTAALFFRSRYLLMAAGCAVAVLLTSCAVTKSEVEGNQPVVFPIAKGWAENSVNAVVFRRNSVVSDETHQYVAYYNAAGKLMLAKRRLGSADWEIKETPYSGNTRDAHNTISIMLDGDGYLHVSWDHHGHQLRYSRSVAPGSLDLTEKMAMTGDLENKVTYPEFHRLANGNLIFLYRDGSSGAGDLIMKKYDTGKREWVLLHAPIIDGEGARNAYWQMCADKLGGLHLSWVWRASSDVATNHDIAYAKSLDGGVTWQKSTGEMYQLPITAEQSEYAAIIPMNSELINTTSMCADEAGNPYIANYWRRGDSDVPQYHAVYHRGGSWRVSQVTNRTTNFSLSGSGSKRIPLSRPQILAATNDGKERLYLIYRDEERQNGVSVAICEDVDKMEWKTEYLYAQSVGFWEPSYDTERWKRDGILSLYLQFVEQGDAEGTVAHKPTMVSVLDWQPR